MTKIIIVAGGLATRMSPITEQIPKCLIDINGTPLIEHQLKFFKMKGYTDIIFCIAHLAEKVKEYFRDGKKLGLNIKYIEEKKSLRGTAGSVKLAEQMIPNNDDFIVFYGDNLTSMDFGRFLGFHKEKKAIATICMRKLPQSYISSSIITLDAEKKICAFLEKPSEDDMKKCSSEQGYINNGIYAFKKEVFKYIPKDTKYDFAKELFPRLLEKNIRIYGYPTEEFFREIGRIEKYAKILEEFKGREVILS